jgi:hypothetical protein
MELKEQKLSHIRNKVDSIIEQMEIHANHGSKIHEVEKGLFSSLLALGLSLLSYYIEHVRLLTAQQGVPKDSHGKKMQHKGSRRSPYFSVFGRMEIIQVKYYSATDKTYYALNSRLGLPKSSYSYLLNDWMSYGAVEMDFEQSVAQLEHILGHHLKGMQSSRRTYALAQEVEPFYEQKDWRASNGHQQEETQREATTHLSVGYDGKGVPIIRGETDRKQENAAIRLSKGQKRGVQKEATVSLSSEFKAKPRCAQDIIDSLFSTVKSQAHGKEQQAHSWHENTHVRAFLSDKEKAVAYGIQNLLERDKTGKPIIVLIDGDRALEKAVDKAVEQHGLQERVDAYVLDLIHVLEYVWRVANARWGENSSKRQEWVKQQLRLLLLSKTEQVLEEWQAIEKEQSLSKSQQYNLERGITYVRNHQHMMDYKTYLEKGYPITTGAIESACGHFVKSRMQRNAMHWGKQGAQKMLNIRAVKKNGDWHDYLEHYISTEQEKLYGRAA